MMPGLGYCPIDPTKPAVQELQAVSLLGCCYEYNLLSMLRLMPVWPDSVSDTSFTRCYFEANLCECFRADYPNYIAVSTALKRRVIFSRT